MKQCHWVEFRQTRDRVQFKHQIATVCNSDRICGEANELIVQFVCILEVFDVLAVLLKPDSKGIEDCILLRVVAVVGCRLVS